MILPSIESRNMCKPVEIEVSASEHARALLALRRHDGPSGFFCKRGQFRALVTHVLAAGVLPIRGTDAASMAEQTDGSVCAFFGRGLT